MAVLGVHEAEKTAETMTTPDWLRAEAAWAKDALHDPQRLLDAADEIERLEAVIRRIRNEVDFANVSR